MKASYINTGAHNGAYNMAFDEALLLCSDPGQMVFRTFTWEPACLSLGCFQKYSEVNEQACKHHCIDIVRRPTGGRAVLHDKELTYSIIVRAPHPLLDQSVLSSYYLLCEGIVRALNNIGVLATLKKSEDNELSTPSCFAAPTFNDIEVNGKKIVGSAQMRTREGLLQHGSILLDVDLNKLFDVVTQDEAQARKLAEMSKKKITSVKAELGKDAPVDEMERAFKAGFNEAMGAIFENHLPKDGFYGKMCELEKQKYSSDAWNKNR